MVLSEELVTQFVKVTNNKTEAKKETTVYGTTVEYNGSIYVKLDGSDLLTPITTTATVAAGERVMVMIKNHTATITGNVSSPSARLKDVDDVSDVLDVITELEILVAGKVSTEAFDAQIGRIDSLVSENVKIKESLTAADGDIDNLQVNLLKVSESLEAQSADIENLKTTKLDAEIANLTYATITELEAVDADIHKLEATYGEFSSVTADRLDAIDSKIHNLEVENFDAVYANVDFSNIGEAAMEYLYSQSGLIENVKIGDGTITGTLVGVTIRGDSIEGNTVIADKLVIKGDDGLYYKLNTDGVSTDLEQTDYNSLNGTIIQAKSITATKISVDDLVAFDATIGGFNITANSIYSDVKDSEGNTTRGIYMDTDGQMNFGDANNYIKYYRDEDGTYKLAISAGTILYDINGNQHSLSDLGIIGEYIKISAYEGEPCIELGETDSEFKLRITNTRIMFMEGSGVPAYFTNQSMHIKKAVIEEELQQGGFVWKARSNGNLGLIWKGATS